VSGVALQGLGFVHLGLPRQDRGDDEVGEDREGHHRDADPEAVDAVLAIFRSDGFSDAAVIGRIDGATPPRVTVR